MNTRDLLKMKRVVGFRIVSDLRRSIKGEHVLDLPKFPILHPKVQEARLIFYEYRRRSFTSRCTLSFEELYELFIAEELTVEEIAEKASISASSMCDLYENHFRRFCGNRSAMDRYLLIQRRQRERRLATIRTTLPDVPYLHFVAEEAANAGHSVETCVRTKGNGTISAVLRTTLVISGIDCRVHVIKRAKPLQAGRTQRFGCVQLARSRVNQADIHIFLIWINGVSRRVLIVPTATILSKLFPHEEARVGQLNVPLKFGNMARRSGRLNVWDFVGRWDLVSTDAMRA